MAHEVARHVRYNSKLKALHRTPHHMIINRVRTLLDELHGQSPQQPDGTSKPADDQVGFNDPCSPPLYLALHAAQSIARTLQHALNPLSPCVFVRHTRNQQQLPFSVKYCCQFASSKCVADMQLVHEEAYRRVQQRASPLCKTFASVLQLLDVIISNHYMCRTDNQKDETAGLSRKQTKHYIQSLTLCR